MAPLGPSLTPGFGGEGSTAEGDDRAREKLLVLALLAP